MTGKSPVRSCEDIDESVLSYAEVKALATGNPHIKEKMTLDVEVAKLKMLKANYSSQKYRMEDNISVNYPEKISALEEKIKGYAADIQSCMQNRPADRETFTMTVGDTAYHSRKEAGAALIEMCRQAGSYDAAVIGEYLGFRITAAQQFFSTKCLIHLKGRISHSSETSSDPFGIIQRMDNVLNAMPEELEKLQRDLKNVRQQLETARLEVAKPFEKEQELAEKSARLAELNSLLDMDKSEETGQPGNAAEQGDSENCQPDSLETGRKAEDAAGRQENGMEQKKTEAVQQPDVQMHGSANAVEKQGRVTQTADGKMTPGCMQVRTSVREKLAAIRERRAAEQARNQAQKPQIKRDRAAAL